MTIFLDITFTADSHTTTCGDFSTIVKNNSNSGSNKLTVISQTNRNRQNKGFLMVVTCVRPDFGDHDDCIEDTHLNLQIPSPSDGAETTKTETEMVIFVI